MENYCPYCDELIEIYDDECDDPSDNYENECSACGKMFIFTIDWTKESYTYKADCLNGSPHEWEPTKTYPISCTKMKCSMCNEHRTPTAEEWTQIYHDEKK